MAVAPGVSCRGHFLVAQAYEMCVGCSSGKCGQGAERAPGRGGGPHWSYRKAFYATGPIIMEQRPTAVVAAYRAGAVPRGRAAAWVASTYDMAKAAFTKGVPAGQIADMLKWAARARFDSIKTACKGSAKANQAQLGRRVEVLEPHSDWGYWAPCGRAISRALMQGWKSTECQMSRLILQGAPFQHLSIDRHYKMLKICELTGLPGKGGKVGKSITTINENGTNPPIAHMINPDESYAANAAAAFAVAHRRKMLSQKGSLGGGADAIYQPPPLPGVQAGSTFPKEVLSVYADNPGAGGGHLAQAFPELIPGLQYYRPPGTFALPPRTAVTVVNVAAAGQLAAAVSDLEQYSVLAFDTEWNTSGVTGGAPSPPMLMQFGAFPGHLRGAGARVSPAARGGFEACRNEGDHAALYNELKTKPCTEIPVDLLAAYAPMTVYLFRLTTDRGQVVGALPDTLVGLLMRNDVTWVGCNHKVDFTLVEKKWGVKAGGTLVDVGANDFHGLVGNAEGSPAPRAKSLEAVSGGKIGIKLWKAKGQRDYDWSGPLVKIWEGYAALDVVLPLPLFYHQQGATMPEMGSGGAARSILWGMLVGQPEGEGPAGGNRIKKGWPHVYRHMLCFINTGHPPRAGFAYVLATHHLIKSDTALRGGGAAVVCAWQIDPRGQPLGTRPHQGPGHTVVPTARRIARAV